MGSDQETAGHYNYFDDFVNLLLPASNFFQKFGFILLAILILGGGGKNGI